MEFYTPILVPFIKYSHIFQAIYLIKWHIVHVVSFKITGVKTKLFFAVARKWKSATPSLFSLPEIKTTNAAVKRVFQLLKTAFSHFSSTSVSNLFSQTSWRETMLIVINDETLLMGKPAMVSVSRQRLENFPPSTDFK